MNSDHERDLHDWVALACIWEATARKAGNVHPRRAFRDLTYSDFVASAVAIAPVFAAAPGDGVGDLVLRAIRATRRVVRSNTNLGIVLLLAPLATARPTAPLRESLPEVLDQLSVHDSQRVYQAIQLAGPSGMGEVPEQDVRDEPTLPLRAVMALAQERDLIARQYVNGFHEVLDEAVPALLHSFETWGNLEDAIVGTHLELLALHPDSLIAQVRTCNGGGGELAGPRRAERGLAGAQRRPAHVPKLRRLAARRRQPPQPRHHRRPGYGVPLRGAARQADWADRSVVVGLTCSK